jgi:hypothetical protein
MNTFEFLNFVLFATFVVKYPFRVDCGSAAVDLRGEYPTG